MKVALLQFDISWGDPVKNRARLDVLLAGVKEKVDLFVFPEMFSTGFATAENGASEPLPSETLEWMKRKAAEKDAAIAGSIAVSDGKRRYNRHYFVKPDGEVASYDKRHLFMYGGEDKTFTAGRERRVVEFRGVRFLLEVCYDLRFPVWARNRGDYDAILYVANWPTVRRLAWDTLLRARAIENQCFVCGVNRVGKDPVCEYDGGTVLVDPYGRIAASAAQNTEEFVIADINLKEYASYSRNFPVLQDADNFKLL